MSPPPIPRELLAAIASAGNDLERAADFIEEHILFRLSKGDSLYVVSHSLLELETKLPARSAPAIRQAQYATNVPPSTDLSPSSAASHAAAASPQTVLAYLVSEPAPDLQHAREVILEYVLTREARLRDKKPGPGGKGTLGRDGLEEIAARLGEIEDGLRGKGPLIATMTAAARRRAPEGTPDSNLPPSRQLGLALVLSLRMLLSYFSLVDLARQLLSQTPQDAVRTLVQHIRRRGPGEGRFNVGRELEYVESLTLHRRPTLRPAFRSARARTHLPPRSLYPVSLPAPSKSACIKLINAFIRDVEQVGPSAASGYMQPNTHVALPSRSKKGSPRIGGAPGSPVSPGMSPNGSPVRAAHVPLPTDATPIENYTLELISEWLTREKREYMLKNKWARTGREQLSKDLLDIENATCVTNRGTPTAHCGALLPVFLLLRRTFSLPLTPLPNAIIGSAYEMLPMPPEPDAVPLSEPTVSSTTAAMYCNPRLPDNEALDAMEELLESEREKGVNANVSEEKTVAWLLGQVDHVQKRFPDGSYRTVFEQARVLAAHPRVWPDASSSSAFPLHPLVSGANHRRSKSSAVTSPASDEFSDLPSVPGASPTSKFHTRSASVPFRNSHHGGLSPPRSTGDDVSPALSAQAVRDSESSNNDPDSDPDDLDTAYARRVAALASPDKATSPKESLPPVSMRNRSGTTGSNHKHHTREPSTVSIREKNIQEARDRFNARSKMETLRSKAPPQLDLEASNYQISTELSDFMEAPPSATATTPVSSVGASSESGWWEVVSAVDPNSPAPRRSPFLPDSRRTSEAPLESPLSASHIPPPPQSLPPGAQTPLLNGASLLLENISEDVPTPPLGSGNAPPSVAATLLQQGQTSPTALRTSPADLPQPFGSMASAPGRRGPPPLSLAEAQHAAAAAAAIAATEAKLAGSNPSSASSTPQATPTMASSARVEGPHGLPRLPSDTEELNELDAEAQMTGPMSAPPTSSRPLQSPQGLRIEPQPMMPRSQPPTATAPMASSATRAPGSFRPPPVPLMIDRPGFPSRAPGGPMSAREPPPPVETAKSKIGAFGRSMSLGARHVMGRGKDKQIEREAIKEQASLARKGTTLRPANNPERWNRDMVSALMGPPVERH